MKPFYENEDGGGELLKSWKIRPYSKSELAEAYSPEVSGRAALSRFKLWIHRHETLYEELQKNGYIDRQQMLTSRQVSWIFQSLGEPLNKHTSGTEKIRLPYHIVILNEVKNLKTFTFCI